MLKKLLRIQRFEFDTQYGRFWVDAASYLGLKLYEQGVYEPEMIEVLEHFLKPGGNFVDIGANEGYFSVIAGKRVGAAGEVLALEPQSRLAAVLERNLSLNELSDHVAVKRVAVGREAGEMALFLAPDVNSGASGSLNVTRYQLQSEQVEVVKLSDVIGHIKADRIDLMKMDIEGGEYDAVLGSSEIFEQKRVKAFALELHPAHLERMGKRGQDIVDFLLSCGYREKSGFQSSVFVAD